MRTTTYWGTPVPEWLLAVEGEAILDHLDRLVKNFDYRTRTFKENPMNPRDCQPGTIYPSTVDKCVPKVVYPETAATTLKRLRKQAKRIRKEIAAVRKQAKRNAKHEAIALAKAKQARRDHKLAMWSLREIVANPAKHDAAARVTAAESLINHAYGD